jgi:multiple sugar transport system ATP-binding protein
MSTLTLENVTKSFGKTEVLSDISLAVEDGEFVVFVGPSGCGKSTLLRIIAGLEEPSGGRVLIGGDDVTGKEPIDRGIAMVFQSYALYPHLSVYENIAFPLRLQKMPKEETAKRVEAAAAILDLTNRLDHKPGQLSGGQRQRVAIGRAIVRDPKVFLFDEPLSNLDASLRGAMRVELSELHQKLETTMIYVTHDQVEAMTMADRIVVLNGSHVEQFGTPMELYHRPGTRFVAGFIGQPGMNFLPATIEAISEDGIVARLADGSLISAEVESGGAGVGDSVEVGIRPDDLDLGEGNGGFKVSVRVVERLGATTIVYGSTTDGAPICAALGGLTPIAARDSIELSVDAASVHVFDAGGQALPRRSTPTF